MQSRDHNQRSAQTSAQPEELDTPDHAHERPQGSVAVILGSAFSRRPPRDMSLAERLVSTPWGEVTVHEVIDARSDRPAYLLFRHGLPHQVYPQQVNFRAQACALKSLHCQALLITSSVGVLDVNVPLDTPLLMGDLLMPDHRLPDGSLCTLLTSSPHQRGDHTRDDSSPDPSLPMALRPGHLVWRGSVSSPLLDTQVSSLAERAGASVWGSVTFAYVAGPRTKTPAENQYWASLGAQVNSMSVGPEVVLASELEIPTVTLMIGHKRSGGAQRRREQDVSAQPKPQYEDHREMTATLDRSHQVLERIVRGFVQSAQPVAFPHYIYRYHSDL